MCITILTWALDHLVRRAAAIRGVNSEFPTGTALAVGLGLAHLPLMALAVWAAGGASGHDLLHRLGLVAGFGSIISEVGAVMLVGGNIEGRTRVLTTAIVLETRRGSFDVALALGIILLLIAFVSNMIMMVGQGRDLRSI